MNWVSYLTPSNITLVLSIATTVATVVLAIVTCQYVKLTRQIVGENRLSRMDGLRPVLVPIGGSGFPYVETPPALREPALELKNIGVGPALRIGVQLEIDLDGRTDVLLAENHTFVMDLAPGDSNVVLQETTPAGMVAVRTERLILRYNDVFGRSFQARFLMTGAGWQSLGIETLTERIMSVDEPQSKSTL